MSELGRRPRATHRRRTVLKMLLGGGLVAAAGVGLRACGVGLLDPANEPYRLWTDPSSEAGFRDLVVAAVLAANPHDSQPWRFRVRGQTIEVRLDRRRALGPVDPVLRQMHLGVGCAIENLCVAARSRGLATSVTLLPDPDDLDLAARVAIAVGGVSDVRHAAVIRRRHTNRGPFHRERRVPDVVRDALAAQATSAAVRLALFDAESERGAIFSRATLTATTALIADADFMRATDAWFRWTPREVAAHADGPSLRCAGLAPAVEVAAMLAPRQGIAKFHASWLATTRDVHLATAPTFGVISIADGTGAQLLEAGRLWQRIHLEATIHGLGMQPLDQAIEAIERARQLGVAPLEPSAAALAPRGAQLAMMFRVGYPVRAAVASARRPLSAVLE